MTFEVPALAAGFASKFDDIGPYIGFGSLVAVVAMAILVFAQGKELQRLREWAGSSPERLDALEEEVRSAAAARQGVPPRPAGYVGPGGVAVPAGAPGAPPRPPGAVGAPGAPVSGAPAIAGGVTAADAGAEALSAGGPARPTPPRPTPPGARPLAAASSAGGPRAATAAGAAATARERERTAGPERSIGQIIGVAVVGVVVLVALLFAFGFIGGGDDKKPNAGTGAGGTPTTTTTRRTPAQRYPATEMATIVLNASGSGGLAGKVSDRVEEKLRLKMAEPTNYTVNGATTNEQLTSVQYRTDGSTVENRQNREAAKAVAAFLKKTVTGVRVLKMSDDVLANAGSNRLVVIVGQDYAAKTPGATTTTTPGTTGGTGSTGGATGSTTTPSTGGQLSTPQSGDLGTQSGGAATGGGTTGTGTP